MTLLISIIIALLIGILVLLLKMSYLIHSLKEEVVDAIETDTDISINIDLRNHVVFLHNMSILMDQCLRNEDYEQANVIKTDLMNEIKRFNDIYQSGDENK